MDILAKIANYFAIKAKIVAIFAIAIKKTNRNFMIMNVVDNIFKIILEKGLKQQALADALNCDDSTISKIKLGKRDLRVNDLDIIATFLDMRIIDLFTYPDRYVREGDDNPIEAVLQIKLKGGQKEQILRTVLGENAYENLTR